MLLLTATIVTYKNNPNQLLKTINSFLTTRLDVHLYIVDNSPEDDLGEIFSDDGLHIYIWIPITVSDQVIM